MPHTPGVKALMPKIAKKTGDDPVAEDSETDLGDSSCAESRVLSSSSSSDDCRMVVAELRKGGHRNYRGENDFELNGQHYIRIYVVNRWTGEKALSGYCIWCSCRHQDTERPI